MSDDAFPEAQVPGSRPILPPGRGENHTRDVLLLSYAAKDARPKSILDSERVLRAFHPPPIFAMGLAMVVVFFVGGTISRATGTNSWMVLSLCTGAAAFAFFLFMRRLRTPRAPKSCTLDPTLTNDSRYRVRLIASRHEAHAIGTLDDSAFEPVVTPILFAMRGRAWVTVTIWAVLGLLLCVAWAFLRRRFNILGVPGGGNPWEWWACFGLAAAPLTFLWPTYIRVSPGLVDVFQYGPLGSGDPKVSRFDIRTAKVLVDLPGKQLVFESPEIGRRIISIGSWTPRPVELARAVLQAARWRHDLTPPSEHELSG